MAMINAITEGFLGEYFLFESIIGRFVDKKKIYDIIGKIWCIEKNEADKLWHEIDDDDLHAIKDADDYLQYLRVCEYCAIINKRLVSFEKRNLIDLKGKTLEYARGCKINAEKCFLKSSVIDLLTDNLSDGNVVALRILGILVYEGIIDELSETFGKNCLLKAMDWGDITAILAAVKYGFIDEKVGVGNLSAATENTYYESIVQKIASVYNVDSYRKSDDILLLRKVFEHGKANKNCFNENIRKIIKGNTLNARDKEKLLFDDEYSYVTKSCDIPLELPLNKIEINGDAFNNMPLSRESEVCEIVNMLKDNDLRTYESYNTPCLCCESKYVKETYIFALADSLKDTNVVRIDVSKLNSTDFERNIDNVFVRNIEERRNNAYIFELNGEICDYVIEQIAFFMQSANRREYLLSRPSVRLNLSSILSICVCDKKNYNAIKKHVDVIDLSEVKRDEKDKVIKDMIIKNETKYYVKSSADDETICNISKLSTDTLDLTLDKFFKQKRKSGKTIIVDEKEIFALSNDNYSHKKYGFGGVYVE